MTPVMLSLVLLAAAPLANKTTVKPLVSEQPLAGGWRVASAERAEDVRLVSAHSASGRTLLVIAGLDDTKSAFTTGEAVLVGADGKTLRRVPMPGLIPSAASLSADGRVAAVIASQANDPNAPYSLLVFDDKGTKLFRKEVDPAYRVLAGPSWVVLWAHTALPGAVEEEDDAPHPGQAPEPALVYDLGGRVLTPGEPLGGSLCASGDAIASVTPGRVALWRTNLTRKARAELDLQAGVPFCAAGGSLVAIGDFAFDDARTSRSLELYDGAAKRTGTIVLEAPLGVDAAVSADGSAIAATAAAPDIAGEVELAGPLEVVVADRAGTTRATFHADRRDPTERAVFLSVANGGTRTAFLRRTADPVSAPDRITVIDASGAILWEADRAATGLALDATGAWLTILDERGVTRVRVSTLETRK